MASEYIVVEHSKYRAFVAEVNKRLSEGFKLVGGVAAATEFPNTLYLQAMVKESE